MWTFLERVSVFIFVDSDESGGPFINEHGHGSVLHLPDVVSPDLWSDGHRSLHRRRMAFFQALMSDPNFASEIGQIIVPWKFQTIVPWKLNSSGEILKWTELRPSRF